MLGRLAPARLRSKIPRRGAAGNRQLARLAFAGNGNRFQNDAGAVRKAVHEIQKRLLAGCVVRFEHLRFLSFRVDAPIISTSANPATHLFAFLLICNVSLDCQAWRDIGAGLAGWEAKLRNDIRNLGILGMVMLLL
jgi:hypothetical protein